MKTETSIPDADEAFFLQDKRRHRRQMVAALAVITLLIVGIVVFIGSSLSNAKDFSLRGRKASVPAEVTPIEVTARPAPAIDRYFDHTRSPLQRVRQTVAIATVTDVKGTFGFATGFILMKGVIVTVAHSFRMLAGSEQYGAQVLCNGILTHGDVVLFDPLREFAVITAPDCEGADMVLRDDLPAPGETLHVTYVRHSAEAGPEWRDQTIKALPIADPLKLPGVTMQQSMFNDIVSDMRREGIGPLLTLTGSFEQGNSGGVVTDDQQRVVGALVGFTREAAHSISSITMKQALTEAGMLL